MISTTRGHIGTYPAQPGRTTVNRLAILALALCLPAALAGSATANDTIAADWRTQYPAACQTLIDATFEAGSCLLCHNPGGASLNPYGSDLAGLAVNFVVAESFDSDGDGRTNGQEILLDCTLPGDFASVPAESRSWSAVKALYR
jgi:hypothetical protein